MNWSARIAPSLLSRKLSGGIWTGEELLKFTDFVLFLVHLFSRHRSRELLSHPSAGLIVLEEGCARHPGCTDDTRAALPRAPKATLLGARPFINLPVCSDPVKWGRYMALSSLFF